MERVVRPYQPTDLDEVMQAWESATRIATPFLTDAFLAQERHNIPNIYLPNTETWVMDEDGLVIGFLALMGNEVAALFVKPDSQGTGAGRALMDKARELRGGLEVEVFEANQIGRKFYDRYGFKLLEKKTHEATGNELLRLGLPQ